MQDLLPTELVTNKGLILIPCMIFHFIQVRGNNTCGSINVYFSQVYVVSLNAPSRDSFGTKLISISISILFLYLYKLQSDQNDYVCRKGSKFKKIFNS